MNKDKWSRWADTLAGEYKPRNWPSRDCYIPAVDTYMRSENGTKLRIWVEEVGRKRRIKV